MAITILYSYILCVVVEKKNKGVLVWYLVLYHICDEDVINKYVYVPKSMVS